MTPLILLAQAVSLGRDAIALIVIGAIVGVVLLALPKMGVPVSDFVYRVLGIIAVAALAIVAIRFLLGLAW